MSRRWMLSLASVMLLCALPLSACQPREQPAEAERRAVKIAGFDELTFDHLYRDFFEARFPHWDITILPLTDKHYNLGAEEELARLFEIEKPDLVISGVLHYLPLADSDQLRDLDEWASRDGWDMAEVPAGVLEYMRKNEDGKLYGLIPFFGASALYYNRTLFETFGIEPPRDRITWREVLTLASRFMQDSRMEPGSYGFHQNFVFKPFDLIESIASAEGLSYVNRQTGEVTIDTESWRDVFQFVIDAFRQGTFRTTDVKGSVSRDGVTAYAPEDMERMDLFVQGKAAMTVAQDDLMKKLKSSPPSFQWGVVQGPVSSRDPDRVGWYTASAILAIPTVSPQPELAWEAIRYLMSDQVGKAAASLNLDLFAHRDFPDWARNADYGVFYAVRPAGGPPRMSASAIPPSFYEPFWQLIDREIGRTLAGETTTEEALRTIQSEGEALLAQEQARADAPAS